jgi:hypothetical protein
MNVSHLALGYYRLGTALADARGLRQAAEILSAMKAAGTLSVSDQSWLDDALARAARAP